MRKLIFIPVREDSKRLPGKALLKVNKLPLWYYTYLQCKKSNADQIYIATNSDNVLTQCLIYDVPFMDINNAWCGTVRVAKAYQKLLKKYEDDLILNVQCDYPQIKPKSINLLFEHGQNWHGYLDFITLYYSLDDLTEHWKQRERENKNIVKIIGSEQGAGNIFCHYFTREYYPWSFGHIGLYLFKPENIGNILNHPRSYLSMKENLEQLTWLSNGAKIKALFTKRELSIDTQGDFDRFKQEIEN